MNDYSERYNLKPAAAWLRGHALRTGVPNIDKELLEMPLEVLTDAELSTIVAAGEQMGQKLYPFKTGKTEMPRVRRVLSFLHGVEFEALLDVGSGRGVFLLPFLEEFPHVKVTSLDLLEKRVTFLNELSAGGYSQLTAFEQNICDQPFPENSFDVVTLLEVLEHIPEVDKAVAAAVKMAKQYGTRPSASWIAFTALMDDIPVLIRSSIRRTFFPSYPLALPRPSIWFFRPWSFPELRM